MTRWECNTCPFTTTWEDAARGHEFAAPPRGWLGDGRAHSLSLIVEPDWFGEVYQGRTVAVAERAGRFSRTGIAIRAWYDEGDRMVRVAINTAREGDRYEVLDFAGNWEARA